MCVLGVPWSVAPKGLSGSGEGSIGGGDGGGLDSLFGSVGAFTYSLCFSPPASGWPARECSLTGLSGQVILCTKEVSVGARKNAFALLVEMGHAFLRFGPSQEGEALVTQDWGGLSAPRPGGPEMQHERWALPWCNLSCFPPSQRPCSATSS